MAISKSTPFTVQADHAGVDTVGYRLYVDGAMAQEKPVAALVSGVISFADADGLPKGSYSLEVSAFNDDGETKSEALTLVVTGTAPGAPVNLRIAAI
jgi:hypothetical protein